MIDALTLFTIGAVLGTLGWLLITNQQTQRTIVMKSTTELLALLEPISTSLSDAATSLTESSGSLTAVGGQLEKATAEIVKALGGIGSIPEDALAKINQITTVAQGIKDTAVAQAATAKALKGASQSLDDLNKDEETAPQEAPAANG